MREIYFNKNLKYLTSNTIITQSKLSKILGVSRQAIYNLLSKDADCRLSTIIKIADAYGIEPSDLIFTDLEIKYKDKKLVYKISIDYKKVDN